MKLSDWRRRLVMAFAVVLASVAGVTVMAQPAQAATGTAVTVRVSGQCLDADLNTINRNGSRVQLWQCNGQAQQKWYIEPDGTIHSGYNGWCLDADTNTANRNGGIVQLWQCNGTAQQRWSKKAGLIFSGLSNRCLDADLNTINRNGTTVQLWDCNWQNQQVWNGLPETSWQMSCTAYGGEQIWQTAGLNGNIGRVREQVCVAYSPATVWAVVRFQLDWPSNCTVSVAFPPSGSVSCNWSGKNKQLGFNAVKLTGNLWVGETQQWNTAQCNWGSAFYRWPGPHTYECFIFPAARTANGRHYTVDVHNTGADVTDDGDGFKLLPGGHYTFVV